MTFSFYFQKSFFKKLLQNHARSHESANQILGIAAEGILDEKLHCITVGVENVMEREISRKQNLDNVL